MSNSPYPELKALSDEERYTMIFNLLEWMGATINSLLCIQPDTTLLPTRIDEMQSHLDRIKQLVLTRGKE